MCLLDHDGHFRHVALEGCLVTFPGHPLHGVEEHSCFASETDACLRRGALELPS